MKDDPGRRFRTSEGWPYNRKLLSLLAEMYPEEDGELSQPTYLLLLDLFTNEFAYEDDLICEIPDWDLQVLGKYISGELDIGTSNSLESCRTERY